MADPYAASKPGRLTFKGGAVATLSKSIDKKKKKNKNKKTKEEASDQLPPPQEDEREGGENIYAIDAAKKMNYQELFPVEAKKFSYRDPKAKESGLGSVEEALDDRVKKKADRYCK